MFKVLMKVKGQTYTYPKCRPVDIVLISRLHGLQEIYFGQGFFLIPPFFSFTLPF